MKIFNIKKRRDWSSYGISISEESIVMSSFSEIKTKFLPSKNGNLLVLISKNIIGNGIFFLEISGKNTNIKRIFTMRGINTVKNTVPIEFIDSDIDIRIFRDKTTTGKIIINSIYAYDNVKDNQEVKVDLLPESHTTLINSEKSKEIDIKDHPINNASNLEITHLNQNYEVKDEYNEIIDKIDLCITDKQLSETLDIKTKEPEEKEERTILDINLDLPIENIAITNNNELKDEAVNRKPRKSKKISKSTVELSSDGPIIISDEKNLITVEVQENKVEIIDEKKELIIEKKEKLTISIFDLDLADDQNDIKRYSSQISFAKKNNKFFIKNNKGFLLENIKNLNNIKMFNTFDEIIKELENTSFDKIVCDKAIEDIIFIEKLNELKSKK